MSSSIIIVDNLVVIIVVIVVVVVVDELEGPRPGFINYVNKRHNFSLLRSSHY